MVYAIWWSQQGFREKHIFSCCNVKKSRPQKNRKKKMAILKRKMIGSYASFHFIPFLFRCSLSLGDCGVTTTHFTFAFQLPRSVLCSQDGTGRCSEKYLERSSWKMRRAPKGDPGKERLLFSIWCEISGKAQREKWTGRGERKEVVGNRGWDKWADWYFGRPTEMTV